MTSQIIILLILLVLSGFFSASETALMSLSPAQVRDMVQKKKQGALTVKRLASHPHKLLITILVGNNLVNVWASVYAAVVSEEIFESMSIAIVTAVMTFFILMFGEIIPKSFATTHNKRFSRLVGYPLFMLQSILWPVVWILEKIIAIMIKAFGGNKKQLQKKVSEDEIKAMICIGAEEGSIDNSEKELIENVLEFTDTQAREIMTPRVEIEALPEDASVKDAAKFIVNHAFSRIPIYRKTIDDVVGVVNVKEVLEAMSDEADEKTIKQIQPSKALKIPPSMKINRLFHLFQKKRTHLAIITDEHGGTAGLVTLEDVLEEIVGEIIDETDIDEDHYKKISDDTVLASGRAILEDLSDELGIVFPHPEHKNISFLVNEKLGRFPRKGEVIKFDKFEIKVLMLDKQGHVAEVRVKRKGKRK